MVSRRTFLGSIWVRVVTLLAEPIAEPDSKDAAHTAQDQRRKREEVPTP
jgi:hypothetical protein